MAPTVIQFYIRGQFDSSMGGAGEKQMKVLLHVLLVACTSQAVGHGKIMHDDIYSYVLSLSLSLNMVCNLVCCRLRGGTIYATQV